MLQRDRPGPNARLYIAHTYTYICDNMDLYIYTHANICVLYIYAYIHNTYAYIHNTYIYY